MKYIFFSAFIFSFFIANGKGKKYPAAFYEEREEIFEKTDTVISYVRASSGSVEHTEQSGYLIYKLNGIYQMHYVVGIIQMEELFRNSKLRIKERRLALYFRL